MITDGSAKQCKYSFQERQNGTEFILYKQLLTDVTLREKCFIP